jgi:hypothetical protein
MSRADRRGAEASEGASVWGAMETELPVAGECTLALQRARVNPLVRFRAAQGHYE